jgi:hypothetical protein
MKKVSRRNFLKFAAMGAGYLGVSHLTIVSAQVRGRNRTYQAMNLKGWTLAPGDAGCTPEDGCPTTLGDIATEHQMTKSVLRANILTSSIMAHNITFKRFFDNYAMNFVHSCRVKFRLPYIPSQLNGSGNPETRNAETFDVGLFIWDGEYDYGMAFSWMLNPWTLNVGNIRQWDGENNVWVDGNNLLIDTNWHTAEFTVNFQQETTSLLIDGNPYASQFTVEEKEFTDSRIAARFQVEAISLNPGAGNGALHEMEIKDWRWAWTL